jgi:translation initiation factor eIF-2B subunit delta
MTDPLYVGFVHAVRVSANVQADDEKIQAKVAKKLAKQQIPQRTEAMKRVEMFSHLQQYRKDISVTNGLSFGTGGIHPAFIKLGLQYAEGVVCGSNARCIALLAAFKKVFYRGIPL